jgi:hypothetical protein
MTYNYMLHVETYQLLTYNVFNSKFHNKDFFLGKKDEL